MKPPSFLSKNLRFSLAGCVLGPLPFAIYTETSTVEDTLTSQYIARPSSPFGHFRIPGCFVFLRLVPQLGGRYHGLVVCPSRLADRRDFSGPSFMSSLASLPRVTPNKRPQSDSRDFTCDKDIVRRDLLAGSVGDNKWWRSTRGEKVAWASP